MFLHERFELKLSGCRIERADSRDRGPATGNRGGAGGGSARGDAGGGAKSVNMVSPGAALKQAGAYNNVASPKSPTPSGAKLASAAADLAPAPATADVVQTDVTVNNPASEHDRTAQNQMQNDVAGISVNPATEQASIISAPAVQVSGQTPFTPVPVVGGAGGGYQNPFNNNNSMLDWLEQLYNANKHATDVDPNVTDLGGDYTSEGVMPFMPSQKASGTLLILAGLATGAFLVYRRLAA